MAASLLKVQPQVAQATAGEAIDKDKPAATALAPARYRESLIQISNDAAGVQRNG